MIRKLATVERHTSVIGAFAFKGPQPETLRCLSPCFPAILVQTPFRPYVKRRRAQPNTTAINRTAGASAALLLASALAVLLLAAVAGTTQHNLKNDVLLNLLVCVKLRRLEQTIQPGNKRFLTFASLVTVQVLTSSAGVLRVSAIVLRVWYELFRNKE